MLSLQVHTWGRISLIRSESLAEQSSFARACAGPPASLLLPDPVCSLGCRHPHTRGRHPAAAPTQRPAVRVPPGSGTAEAGLVPAQPTRAVAPRSPVPAPAGQSQAAATGRARGTAAAHGTARSWSPCSSSGLARSAPAPALLRVLGHRCAAVGCHEPQAARTPLLSPPSRGEGDLRKAALCLAVTVLCAVPKWVGWDGSGPSSFSEWACMEVRRAEHGNGAVAVVLLTFTPG